MKALQRAIKEAGGLTELALKIGTTPQVIHAWRVRGHIPPDRAKDIEKALKKAVTREELCPEIFKD